MTFYILDKPKVFAQGDIFKNIPYISSEAFISVNANPKDMSITETKEIVKEICQNGGSKFIKTFISSTVCILITQDCDVVNEQKNREAYYTFLPLESFPDAKEMNYNQVDDIIRDENYNCYLPEIKLPNKTVGPYKIRFEFPIYIKKSEIEPYLLNNWIARIPFFTKQLLNSKFSHYYIRPAIDEVMYMNLNQINQKIQKIYNDEILTEGEKARKINEFQDALKLSNRENEFEEIIWIGIKSLKSYIKQINSKIRTVKFEKAQDVIDICEIVKNSKNHLEIKDKFIEIYKILYLSPNPIISEEFECKYNFEEIKRKKYMLRSSEENDAIKLEFFLTIKDNLENMYNSLFSIKNLKSIIL